MIARHVFAKANDCSNSPSAGRADPGRGATAVAGRSGRVRVRSLLAPAARCDHIAARGDRAAPARAARRRPRAAHEASGPSRGGGAARFAMHLPRGRRAGRRGHEFRVDVSHVAHRRTRGYYVHYTVSIPAKTQPFSIRLGEQANLLVEDEVRRSGRSRSVVVEELTEEAAKTRLHPGVAFRGRPRRAWVIGSGLDVWEIIELLGSYLNDVVALRADHPLVTDRHLRTARAYAAQFTAEIDAQMAENRRPESRLADLYPFLQQPGR
jgi:hypothetical protein